MMMELVNTSFISSINFHVSIYGNKIYCTRCLQLRNRTYMPLCLRIVVWKSTSKEYITRDIHVEVGAPARRKLEVREVLEQLRAAYYALEEGVTSLEPEVADNIVNYWINGLTVATGKLIQTSAAEMLASEPALASKIDVSTVFNGT
jgi:hypothetical protein